MASSACRMVRCPVAAFALLVAVAGSPARAQPPRAPIDVLTAASAGASRVPGRWLVRAAYWTEDANVGPHAIRTAQRGAGARVTRSKTARVVLGALGGFVVGAYLGAKIEGHSCACDDPGLKGAMIGAPIGAAAGGILAAEFW